jgi:hypothetical protein
MPITVLPWRVGSNVALRQNWCSLSRAGSREFIGDRDAEVT